MLMLLYVYKFLKKLMLLEKFYLRVDIFVKDMRLQMITYFFFEKTVPLILLNAIDVLLILFFG